MKFASYYWWEKEDDLSVRWTGTGEYIAGFSSSEIRIGGVAMPDENSRESIHRRKIPALPQCPTPRAAHKRLFNTDLRRFSGYFKSRRQYDIANSWNAVKKRNMAEEKQELMAGHDLVFQDSHWEFSVCKNYLDGACREQNQNSWFKHVPLPLNHSTDFNKWTACRVSPVCEAISPIQAGHDQGGKG
ncbi:unnamed protein product [Caenorhabditis brenneri]